MENELAAQLPEQETAAPVQAESAPAESTEKVETVTKPEASEKEPAWFVKRIGEMTAKWRADERRAQAAEQELQYLRSQIQQQPKVEEKPKTLADFEYDESKYQSYLFSEAEKRAEAAARRVQTEQAEKAQAARSIRKFQEREAAFEKEASDYRDVAYTAPISNDVVDIIRELESGPELAYYLGKNREIALHLSDLPPRIAAVELGRIDAKITAEKQAKAAALEAAKTAKAVTKAPPPPPNIEGSGESHHIAPDDADSDKLPMSDWLKRREKQVRKRQGA